MEIRREGVGGEKQRDTGMEERKEEGKRGMEWREGKRGREEEGNGNGRRERKGGREERG